MRLHLCAVGRLRGGPEHDLYQDYAARFDRLGRGLSLGPLALHEIEDKKHLGPKAEAVLLERALPAGAALIALDERGTQLSSPSFAQLITEFRDHGRADLAFVIGGADGIAPELRGRADALLGLGPMVWPHMLVRVMLAEQIYRAASILAGLPYHRS